MMNDQIIEFPEDEQTHRTLSMRLNAVECTLLAEPVDLAYAAMRHIQLARWSAAHVGDSNPATLKIAIEDLIAWVRQAQTGRDHSHCK